MFEQTELHKCGHCKRMLCVGEGDNEVTYRTNPFWLEIHNDHTKQWLCGNCAEEWRMEI